MSRCGEALKAQPSRCVSILSRSAAFPPSLVEVTAGQRPAHSERKRASFVFFKAPDDRGGWPFNSAGPPRIPNSEASVPHRRCQDPAFRPGGLMSRCGEALKAPAIKMCLDSLPICRVPAFPSGSDGWPTASP